MMASKVSNTPVREPVLAQVLPDVLDRVELGGARGQDDEGDVLRHAEARGRVPAGAVEEEHGVGAAPDSARDLIEVELHGIDLGKNSCSVVGLDGAGQVVLRRRMRRDTIVTMASRLPACVVAMEACCGAHHLGRLLAGQGHSIRLRSPEYVRP